MKQLLNTINESTIDFIDFLKECIGPAIIMLAIIAAGAVVLHALGVDSHHCAHCNCPVHQVSK